MHETLLLHGTGAGLHLGEYLFRVLLHLVAFAGIALVVHLLAHMTGKTSGMPERDGPEREG